MEPKYKLFFQCLKTILEIAQNKYDSICEYKDPNPEILECCKLAVQGLESLQYQLQSWIDTTNHIIQWF